MPNSPADAVALTTLDLITQIWTADFLIAAVAFVCIASAETSWSTPATRICRFASHGHVLRVHLEHLDYIDHACIELLNAWEKQHHAAGGTLTVQWDQLRPRREMVEVR